MGYVHDLKQARQMLLKVLQALPAELQDPATDVLASHDASPQTACDEFKELKLRRMRGEYWLDAGARATTEINNTTHTGDRDHGGRYADQRGRAQ